MVVNLTNFGNGTLSINTSLLEDTTNIIPNTASTADSFTSGYFSISIFLILYVFLLYELTKDNGMFRLDFVRSNVIASGLLLIIGAVLLQANIIGSFYILVWFGMIFLISLIIEYNKKAQGL